MSFAARNALVAGGSAASFVTGGTGRVDRGLLAGVPVRLPA